MFHFKNNIAASLALFVMITATTSFAEDNPQATPVNSGEATQIADNSIAIQADAATPKTDTTQPEPAATLGFEENQEAVRLRSGKGNPISGKAKSELCQGCHGFDGNSFEPMFPSLAGQYSKYIIKQIEDFRSRVRAHEIMSAIAMTVNDVDLADIAAYFASQTKMQGDGTEGPQLGQKIFMDGDLSRMIVGCSNCHGETGKGKTARNSLFPVIGGQQKDYILGQLTNFKIGARSNSPGGVMNIITQRMTDAELEAVADYASKL